MKYVLKIYRGTPQKQYFEEFKLHFHVSDNVISALMAIRANPINIHGEKVAPIVWEDGCLEEVCGSCSMLINGYPRQACTALIEEFLKQNPEEPIVLAPFTKFPLVRDLIIDRSSMFSSLKKVHGWIDAAPSSQATDAPLISPEKQQLMYKLSTCMTCGCCLEGCPQVSERSDFIGPAAISQARLFNTHPTGKEKQSTRLHALMGKEGISECGNAQTCVKVCPKKIPLTDSIAVTGRDVTIQAFRDIFTSE